MKTAVAIVLTLALAAVANAAFDCSASAPRCVDVAVPVPAGLSVPENHVRVFLPTGYDPQGTATYPVLYLLHGAGDTYKTWSENTDAFTFTADKNVIVVMPDGGKNSDAGWYSDWVDESRQWETFHIDVMIPFIESTYRANGKRLIAGLSMGGFGAMHYAARHSDLFKAAASFSGAVDMLYGFPVSGVAFTELHDMFGTPNDNVWGNQITDEKNWEANNPASLKDHLKGMPLFLASGDGIPGASAASPLVGGPPSFENPQNPGGYLIEQFIFQMNLSFVLHLTLSGVAHTDWFYPGGLHDWPYWEADLHWALPQMLEAIQ
jgi:diacylglycerol O-acyltransferase / trehalose O-mycolyltransferase